jgi:uncharacterized protein
MLEVDVFGAWKMKSTLEIMAEILPSVRAEIAKELVNTHKMNQSDVSRILGVSQPAISQYVRQLRGRKAGYEGAIRQEIKGLAEKLISGKTSVDLESELFNICKAIAQGKAIPSN